MRWARAGAGARRNGVFAGAFLTAGAFLAAGAFSAAWAFSASTAAGSASGVGRAKPVAVAAVAARKAPPEGGPDAPVGCGSVYTDSLILELVAKGGPRRLRLHGFACLLRLIPLLRQLFRQVRDRILAFGRQAALIGWLCSRAAKCGTRFRPVALDRGSSPRAGGCRSRSRQPSRNSRRGRPGEREGGCGCFDRGLAQHGGYRPQLELVVAGHDLQVVLLRHFLQHDPERHLRVGRRDVDGHPRHARIIRKHDVGGFGELTHRSGQRLALELNFHGALQRRQHCRRDVELLRLANLRVEIPLGGLIPTARHGKRSPTAREPAPSKSALVPAEVGGLFRTGVTVSRARRSVCEVVLLFGVEIQIRASAGDAGGERGCAGGDTFLPAPAKLYTGLRRRSRGCGGFLLAFPAGLGKHVRSTEHVQRRAGLLASNTASGRRLRGRRELL